MKNFFALLLLLAVLLLARASRAQVGIEARQELKAENSVRDSSGAANQLTDK
jgi:hypothetical protein